MILISYLIYIAGLNMLNLKICEYLVEIKGTSPPPNFSHGYQKV